MPPRRGHLEAVGTPVGAREAAVVHDLPSGRRPAERPDPYEGALCAWCSSPAVAMRLVEHARTFNKGSKTHVISPDRYVPICGVCDRHLPQPKDPATEKKREAGRAGSWKKKQEKMF